MIRIEFPQPAPLLSMNDRQHWAAWRWNATAAAVKAIPSSTRMPMQPCVVSVALPVKDKRRRDPHNYFATVKPIVDGLVDAGLWPDDTPEWVTTVEPTLVPGATSVVVTLTPREAA